MGPGSAMKMITLDPAHRQGDEYVNYAYTRDFLEDPKVLVLEDSVPQFVLDHSQDLGCFEFSDGSYYYFVIMDTLENSQLAHCTGCLVDKFAVLDRFG